MVERNLLVICIAEPFVWGPPSSVAGSGEAGNAASSAAANGHTASPFTFSTAGAFAVA